MRIRVEKSGRMNRQAGTKVMVCSFVAALLFAWYGVAAAQPADEEQLPEDYQVFMLGFNAYQHKDFNTALVRLNQVMKQYPDTPLRDVTLFWLASANYKGGNRDMAARLLSQLSREYPDTMLRGMADEGLNRLAIRYDLGDRIPVANLSAKGDAS